MQATNLLHFPDLAEGDLNREQRKDALLRMVNVHRPLAALVLFLGVVALEDFIRDLGARLADVDGLTAYFPAIAELRPVAVKQPRAYARPDRDPASLSDWPAVNELYTRVLGAAPFNESDIPRLHDLAIIRHTVAHHAALIRPVDIPRFRFWLMHPNALINPPVEFVQTTSHFLYQIGRTFENSVSDRIMSAVLKNEASDWLEKPSNLLLTLIETFNWFGNILTDDGRTPVYGDPGYEAKVLAANTENRDRLNRHCLDELSLRYPA